MALKKPEIWDKKAGPIIEQGESTNSLTTQSTDESINELTNELTSQLINQPINQLTTQSIDSSESLLSGLKRVDNDKKVMGFHLTGDVRKALKMLKADDYEMSEVVNEMLRKYLPEKYFKGGKKR